MNTNNKVTRKKEIVQNAATLFKQKGYAAVTMRDLAKALGMQAASLYNHIDSKQGILQEIIIDIAERFTQGMATILKQRNSNIEKLKNLIALHVNIAINNPDALAALNSDWMHLEGQLKYYQQLRNDYEYNFCKIIESGIRDDEIKAVDVKLILFSMLSTLRSLYLWIPKNKKINEHLLCQNITDILIEGIRK